MWTPAPGHCQRCIFEQKLSFNATYSYCLYLYSNFPNSSCSIWIKFRFGLYLLIYLIIWIESYTSGSRIHSRSRACHHPSLVCFRVSSRSLLHRCFHILLHYKRLFCNLRQYLVNSHMTPQKTTNQTSDVRDGSESEKPKSEWIQKTVSYLTSNRDQSNLKIVACASHMTWSHDQTACIGHVIRSHDMSPVASSTHCMSEVWRLTLQFACVKVNPYCSKRRQLRMPLASINFTNFVNIHNNRLIYSRSWQEINVF